jgi:hypothetical protein
MLFAAGAIFGLAGAWRLVPRPEPLPPYQRVEEDAGLDRVIASVRFDAISFADAIHTIAQQTHANIVLDTRSLEAAGVDANAPVTFQLHDVRLRTVLREILDTVSGNTTKLGWRAEGGVIFVTTDEDASRQTEVRLYSIGDLIDQHVDAAIRGTSSPYSPPYSQGSLIANVPPNSPPLTRADLETEASDSLIKIITEMISPETWRDAGGSSGQIYYFDRTLWITVTADNHDRIANLLRQFRSGGVK